MKAYFWGLFSTNFWELNILGTKKVLELFLELTLGFYYIPHSINNDRALQNINDSDWLGQMVSE